MTQQDFTDNTQSTARDADEVSVDLNEPPREGSQENPIDLVKQDVVEVIDCTFDGYRLYKFNVGAVKKEDIAARAFSKLNKKHNLMVKLLSKTGGNMAEAEKLYKQVKIKKQEKKMNKK